MSEHSKEAEFGWVKKLRKLYERTSSSVQRTSRAANAHTRGMDKLTQALKDSENAYKNLPLLIVGGAAAAGASAGVAAGVTAPLITQRQISTMKSSLTAENKERESSFLEGLKDLLGDQYVAPNATSEMIIEKKASVFFEGFNKVVGDFNGNN